MKIVALCSCPDHPDHCRMRLTVEGGELGVERLPSDLIAAALTALKPTCSLCGSDATLESYETLADGLLMKVKTFLRPL